MAEMSSHKRRIVKRVAMLLATLVLLLSCYLVSCCGVWWLFGRGTISGPTLEKLQTTVFAPAALYCRYGLPGYRILADASAWAQNKGQNGANSKTWRQVRSRWDREPTTSPIEQPPEPVETISD
jgi:hypothetical protein